jgi:hypothetical protein
LLKKKDLLYFYFFQTQLSNKFSTFFQIIKRWCLEDEADDLKKLRFENGDTIPNVRSFKKLTLLKITKKLYFL